MVIIIKKKLIQISIAFIISIILVFGFNILGDEGKTKIESVGKNDSIGLIARTLDDLDLEFEKKDIRDDIDGIDSIQLKNSTEEIDEGYSQIQCGIIGNKENNNLRKELVMVYNYNKAKILDGNLISIDKLNFQDFRNLLLSDATEDLSVYSDKINEIIKNNDLINSEEIKINNTDELEESIFVKSSCIVYRLRISI